MIQITIPGRASYNLKNLVLDLNGTIALDGEIVDGVEERLERLGKLLSISIVTADTYGSAARLGQRLGITIDRISAGGEDAQKVEVVRKLGAAETVSMGNGANDGPMLKESAIGICVLGGEGAAVAAMMSADLVAPNINAALELLLDTRRLVATLRT